MFMGMSGRPRSLLRPPGGSIIDFSAHFKKAVLLSYAFILDPYNLMAIGPIRGILVRIWAYFRGPVTDPV